MFFIWNTFHIKKKQHFFTEHYFLKKNTDRVQKKSVFQPAIWV